MTDTVAIPAKENSRALQPVIFCLLSVVTGMVAGLGAVLFRALIALVHNLSFLGRLSATYEAKLHTSPSAWGPLVILVPVLGAVCVTFLVEHFAKEAKGHGVPEVMDAIYFNRGRIRPVVAVIKSLASAISIGTGGSVGREGPIVQIGSAFGSTVGQLLRLSVKQSITLIAAGAGAGIAATFNTPIGGVLFAAELLLHEISVWTVVPVVLATASATYIGQIFFGAIPSFNIAKFGTSHFHLASPLVLLCCLALGALMGLSSSLFIRCLYRLEDLFEAPPMNNSYVRHMSGMLLVGIIIYVLMRYSGHYYVEGVGYATIQDILDGSLTAPLFLLLLFLLKLASTCITLGSGGSGGVFSPSLFLGATAGAAFGSILNHLLPQFNISPAAFAVVGMAAVVAGTTGAAMTAIVMIFEMTLDYSVVLPITIAVAASYGTRKLLCKESIYTMKLTRRGHYVPEAMQTDIISTMRAKDMMGEHFVVMPPESTMANLKAVLSGDATVQAILTPEEDGSLTVRSREAAERALERSAAETSIAQVTTTAYSVVHKDTPMTDIIDMARANSHATLLVTSTGTLESVKDVKGIVSSHHVLEALAASTALFTEL